MADIFISYSKPDQDEARLLAAFLEAEGYSVWWDASLASGESFRKTIMTELGRARAAIVIWTESSINSDWVQSEAGRAHADRKLIPVKAKSLAYKDIPPPFDNMHIDNVGERDKILGAIVAQLAKPEVPAGAFTSFKKQARFELLSWFGIIGATISLVANLQGVLTFAKWVHQLMESWTEIFKFIWQHILFFLPKVYGSDAIMLTFVAFAAINMVVCLRRTDVQRAKLRHFLGIGVASLLIIIVFGLGMDRLTQGETATDQGYYFSLLQTYTGYVVDMIDSLGRGWKQGVAGSIYVLTFLVLPPLVPIWLAYIGVRRFAGVRFSGLALCARLWRILAGIGLVIAVNYLSLWLEHEPWSRTSSPGAEVAIAEAECHLIRADSCRLFERGPNDPDQQPLLR